MTDESYIMLVLGMGAVTYLPRWLPLAILSRRKLPDWLVTWLDFVPAAILSALVAPALFVGEKGVSFQRPDLLVAVPTLLFAWRTKSLGGTVLVGMACYWGLTSITG